MGLRRTDRRARGISKVISKAGEFYVKSTAPGEVVETSLEDEERAKTYVKVRDATDTAKVGTKKVLVGIGKIGKAVGGKGAELVKSTDAYKERQQRKVDEGNLAGKRHVGGAALSALSKVKDGFSDGAKLIGKHAKATVVTVQVAAPHS